MAGDCDLAVVGGGPAGMSCAITAHGLGLRTVLFERIALGGELATLTTIHDLPGRRGMSGPDLAADLMDEVLDSGVTVEYVDVEGLKSHGDRWMVNGETSALATVLATGVEPDLDRLPGARERAGRGVSSCSSCDGPLFKGKRVAVVGEGEYAARMALEVSTFAESVTMLVATELAVSRGTRDLLEGRAGIELLSGTAVTGLAGTPVDGVRISSPEGPLDLEVEGVFIGLPRVADAALFEQAGAVVGEGRCCVDGLLRAGTSGPPLFAIGDVRAGASQTVAGAMGDGVAAAWAVARAVAGVAV